MKRVPLIRRTPLRSYSTLARAPLRRKRSVNGFSEDVRAIVRRRSRGICEVGIDGCGIDAAHMHHILPRRYGDHSAANALHVCGWCHSWVHTHPTFSYEQGWLRRGV